MTELQVNQNDDAGWIVCQLGAREHYAVSRALSSQGRLAAMFTDAWIRPGQILGTLHPRLKGRYHSDLDQQCVASVSNQLIIRETCGRVLRRGGWEAICQRNRWFSRQAVRWLKRFAQTHASRLREQPPTVFAYSYTAGEIFQWATDQGWNTVLGQIDPGVEEERLMVKTYERYDSMVPSWECAPAEYWDDWYRECELARTIVVNSSWSAELLQRAGISDSKIREVSLAYEPTDAARHFVRDCPRVFNSERPLRVLFLGQVIPRKGVVEILEAARLLQGRPVEFVVVGPQLIPVPQELKCQPNVQMVGAVPRSEVDDWYRRADVFLFPTHSDGFGLTQLEAQSWKLPLISSKHCGSVVEHEKNGLLLESVTAENIAEALKRLCSEAGLAATLSAGQLKVPVRSVSELGKQLLTLTGTAAVERDGSE